MGKICKSRIVLFLFYGRKALNQRAKPTTRGRRQKPSTLHTVY